MFLVSEVGWFVVVVVVVVVVVLTKVSNVSSDRTKIRTARQS